MPGTSKEYCSKHYSRKQRHGDPLWEPPTLVERFWAKVNKDGPIPEYAPHLGPCWLWTGAKSSVGYGQFKAEDRQEGAHRWLWQLVNGPVPEDTPHLDHLCRVTYCVNPSHLEPVTVAENCRRSPITQATVNAAKTHCKWGHEYTPENTRRDAHGYRQCRECGRKHHLNWLAAQKELVSA